MEVINKEIKEKEQLKEAISNKFYVFKRELQYLQEAKSMRGWNHKMLGMLECMDKVHDSLTSKEVNAISMEFIHVAEIMESNARPYRINQEEEDALIKQNKLNEMELTYYRNKNS